MTASKSAAQRSDSVDRPADRTHGSSGGQGPAAAFDSVVCFTVAGRSYALDVAVVREVVGIEHVIPVPRTPPAIAGAFALRGATVALIDTRSLFGLDAASPATTALIVASGHRTICGLMIERVMGVAPFVAAKFTPAVRGREPPQVWGFMPDDHGGLMTVLDTQTLLRSLESLRF
jgi:purine-binding chemotaxis protein CheW